MTPDTDPTRGQDPSSPVSQPGISPAAQWYMSLKAEAQPGASPAAAPPADPGQGGGDGGGTPEGGDGGFNWGLFPDVPEAQRALLEPHLKNVQGHVTKLEQQYAPYKGLIDQGMDADTVQGILQLNEAFDKNPMGTWVQMGREMQQQGLLNGDLDMEAVVAILEGKEVEEPQPQGGQGGQGAEGEEIPPWAQQLTQRLDERDQRDQQMQQTQQQQQQDAELQTAMDGMRSQLKEAGLSDEQIEGINLVGPIIANNGDPDAALREILGFWESSRRGLTDNANGNGNGSELEAPKGAPPSGKESQSRKNPEFADARAAAKQFLDRKREAEAS